MAPARKIETTKVVIDHDPETGAFLDRLALEDEVDENVLASKPPFKMPQGALLVPTC